MTTWTLASRGTHRLPELEAVALRVAEHGEATVRITLRVHVDRLAGAPQLVGDLVEVVDAEVDHPGLLGWPDHLRALVEGRKGRRAGLLDPGFLLVGLRNRVHSEAVAVPGRQPLGIARTKEEPADPGDPLHGTGPLLQGVAVTRCRGARFRRRRSSASARARAAGCSGWPGRRRRLPTDGSCGGSGARWGSRAPSGRRRSSGTCARRRTRSRSPTVTRTSRRWCGRGCWRRRRRAWWCGPGGSRSPSSRGLARGSGSGSWPGSPRRPR